MRNERENPSVSETRVQRSCCEKVVSMSWAVYNSIGQFQARFTSYARAVRWAIREGIEWSAVIRKEVQS